LKWLATAELMTLKITQYCNGPIYNFVLAVCTVVTTSLYRIVSGFGNF